MCGLFGAIVPLDYPQPRRRALGTCIQFLGTLSQERGTDGAGLATLLPLDSAEASPATLGRARVVSTGGWTIRRTERRFTTLPQTALCREARRAQVILGHTRWATQGRRTLANASPMLVGSVLGTHNGDLDIASLRPFTAYDAAGTDSAYLYAALSDAHYVGGALSDVLPILAKSVGRLAAVWTDLSTPGQVWLTRGALSPLAVARDRHGAIWWASNPTWLRRMQHHLDIELGAIAMLHEGTLLVASIAKRRCDLTVAATYMPHARFSDQRIANIAAWRGFSASDRARDQSGLRHRLVSDRSQNASAIALAGYSSTSEPTVDTVGGALI